MEDSSAQMVETPGAEVVGFIFIIIEVKYVILIF